MIYVSKEYETKTKMVQEQWLQLKMTFLLGYRLVNKWHAIALAHPHTCKYLFRCAIAACAKVYMMS